MVQCTPMCPSLRVLAVSSLSGRVLGRDIAKNAVPNSDCASCSKRRPNTHKRCADHLYCRLLTTDPQCGGITSLNHPGNHERSLRAVCAAGPYSYHHTLSTRGKSSSVPIAVTRLSTSNSFARAVSGTQHQFNLRPQRPRLPIRPNKGHPKKGMVSCNT